MSYPYTELLLFSYNQPLNISYYYLSVILPLLGFQRHGTSTLSFAVLVWPQRFAVVKVSMVQQKQLLYVLMDSCMNGELLLLITDFLPCKLASFHWGNIMNEAGKANKDFFVLLIGR